MKASDSDWDLLISELCTIDWVSIYGEKSPGEVSDVFIESIENAVIIHMKKLDSSKPSGFNSNNMIPKKVQKLFKKKCRLSKQLQTVTSINRCTNIRESILKIDIELKTHYNDRRHLKEDILFKNTNGNKNF